MLKKIVLGMAIAAAASSSFAATYNACDYYSGLYAGAGVNFANSADKLKASTQDINLGFFAQNPGFGGNLFLGYGRVLNNQMYLGGEVYSNLGYRKQSILATGTERQPTVKTKYELGVMAKAGYLVSQQALLYVGLGAQNARFDFNAPRSNDVVTGTYNKWGFAPSVGMDLAINQNWQIGARYTYVNYRDIDFGKDATGTESLSYKPARNTFGLNVTYRFNNI